MLTNERCAVERARLDAPRPLTPEHLGREFGHRVGDERARDACFEVALRAVVEQRASRLDRGGGVGEVVGDDLVVVDRAGGRGGANATVHDALRGVDRRRGRSEVGGSHPADVTDG